MLIRFWFGAIHIGRPSRIGTEGEYDASITWCWGRRNCDLPPGEMQWRFVWRFAWDWFPTAEFQCEREPLSPSDYAYSRLIASIAGGEPKKSEIVSHWTGREKFVGWRDWRNSVTVIRSTRRSKMYVYLTGAKERRNPKHILRIAPAAVVGISKAPSEWLNDDGTAKNFEIDFIHGRASVDNQLGEWLIKTGQCQRTNLIRRTASTLGSLAAAIRGA